MCGRLLTCNLRAASYLPGQSKNRDALNSDARDPTNRPGVSNDNHPVTGQGKGVLGKTADKIKGVKDAIVGNDSGAHRGV